MKRFIQILAVTILILLVTAQTSYAYIDPGSGSLVMAAVLGFFAAIGYTFRKYFYKIRRFFGGGPSDSADDESQG